MPQKILFIASRSDIAGGEKYLLSVFRHLDRVRFTPLVLLPEAGAFRVALDALGIESILLSANYSWLKPPEAWYPFLRAYPDRVRAIANIIRGQAVALVHTNSNKILEGALAARLCGIPHVYAAHIEYQADIPVYQRMPMAPETFASLMGELSSDVVAVSSGVAAALRPSMDPRRLHVILNGVELSDFDRAAGISTAFKDELGLGAGDLLVCAIGRIHPDKGFDFLVEAAGLVISACPNVHFAIIGTVDSDQYCDQLRARVSALGIAANLHFVPYRNDIPNVLSQTDIFVLSSRREGHPFVLLEAMASGCPAVATNCNGVVDTVVPNETGVIVPIGDSDAIAAAVLRLVRDSALRMRFGSAGAARVRERFTAEAMAVGLQDVYSHALSSKALRLGSTSVDLFLQACTEIGYLGEELTDLRRRVKRTERVADLVLDNPLMRLARKIRRALDRSAAADR